MLLVWYGACNAVCIVQSVQQVYLVQHMRISSLVCTVCVYSQIMYNIVYIESTVQYVQFDMLNSTCMVKFPKNSVHSSVCIIVHVQFVHQSVHYTVPLVWYVKCSTLLYSMWIYFAQSLVNICKIVCLVKALIVCFCYSVEYAQCVQFVQFTQ